MKLKDKPLTERQLKFAHLYALDGGLRSNTEIAIEAGYPKASAYQRAYELLSEEHCPHVINYIREIQKDVEKKFDLNTSSHLKKLYELRDTAVEKGMLGVALRAEELRGKTKGKQPRNHVPKQTCLQRRAGVRARCGSRLTNQEPDSGNVRCLTRICLALCLAEK